MKKAVVIFGVVAALFMLTGCPKEKVNVVGAGDGEMVGGSSESTSSISSKETGDLLGSVYFDFDKFVIRPDMQSVVDVIATQAQSQDSIQLVIEGNTDEFGTDEYNYALGTKRAIAVRDALVVKGMSRDSIRVVSFGESKPICMDKTRDCYQKNRRSDVKVSK
ncbi:OmpA family protein [Helicobacter zhangjianzhongii]|uniref:OmpA family protein n=1 Tax=Helicobacter zhangjianzhongii TaxID=2974574 RepID=A0ACC6FS94_9HELI|nr:MULTISPECIES: OmpA family protein [unclassified Helicobacter]MDL0079756.1 OmpA family protein [Helicobacter sp. CPD2-1]MDL0082149.1 OmpA family protein [Helicobacter sp. XJK30-2]